MKLVLGTAFVLCWGIFSAGKAAADVNGPYSFGFNLGVPMAVGETTNVLNDGFGFGLDFGYRPESSPLGIRLDMIYANFDLSSSVLKQVNYANDGYATLWGFGLSAVLAPPNANKVRPYLQFGPGFYYEHAEAYRYSGSGGVVCDPWFGCWETGTTQPVADYATWRLGWVGGAGLNIEFNGGGALFLQAQYHVVNNENQDLEIVPISLGFRQSF